MEKEIKLLSYKEMVALENKATRILQGRITNGDFNSNYEHSIHFNKFDAIDFYSAVQKISIEFTSNSDDSQTLQDLLNSKAKIAPILSKLIEDYYDREREEDGDSNWSDLFYQDEDGRVHSRE